MSSLTEQFKHFARDQLPFFDVLTIKLEENGQRNAVTEERSDSTKAFVAAKKPNSFAKQKKRKDIVCFNSSEKDVKTLGEPPKYPTKFWDVRNFKRSVWC